MSELTSDTTNWLVTAGGGGPAYPAFVLSPIEVNGPSPVSDYPAISQSAKWIWTNQYGNGDFGYIRSFSTSISLASLEPSVIPEPATFSLLGLGLLGLLFRKKKIA